MVLLITIQFFCTFSYCFYCGCYLFSEANLWMWSPVFLRYLQQARTSRKRNVWWGYQIYERDLSVYKRFCGRETETYPTLWTLKFIQIWQSCLIHISKTC